MRIRTHTVFPNYLFEQNISIPDTMIETLKIERDEMYDSGITTDTNFGWRTNKEYPLAQGHAKLCKLISHHFINDCQKVLPTQTNEIQVCNPYVLGVNPGHQYNVNIEPMRWYNALLFLQTTDKGSHLYLNNFSEKLYAQQNTQESVFVVKPKTNKVVFFPSHIPWGLSANESMIENLFLCLTFRIGVQAPNPARRN